MFDANKCIYVVTRCDTPTINAMIQPHPSTTVTLKTNISTAIYIIKSCLKKKLIYF